MAIPGFRPLVLGGFMGKRFRVEDLGLGLRV